MGHLDDVGACFAVDRKFHRFVPVDAHDHFPFRMRALHLGHIPDAYGGAALAHQGQIADFVHGLEFVQGAHQVARGALEHFTGRRVQVLRCQSLGDCGGVEALGRERVRVHRHKNLLS